MGQGTVHRQIHVPRPSHSPTIATRPIKRAGSKEAAAKANDRAEAGRRFKILITSASVASVVRSSILRCLLTCATETILIKMAAAASETESGEAPEQVASKKRSRAKAPKVRTGCLTCKIRRVKCDGGSSAQKELNFYIERYLNLKPPCLDCPTSRAGNGVAELTSF